MEQSAVRVWKEQVMIPTYEVGEPDKNPMFFENRVYQGSSGVVYPNPVIEKIYDDRVDKAYVGLFLENEYIRVMILPELGGRVQMAFDKIGNRHFVYHNQVIKPALVGLCGPWISGGIEFNWPQHHRPSTFEPIDYDLEELADGSCVVWVNEVEKMFGTRCSTGFTLHPRRAYLEINVHLYNRTALPQTFLWWANPAVKVNDHYQSVFPPDVNAVFDHGKRDVSEFPIATGTYYKVNYAPGTDISRYKNIPVPTSYMAIHSDFDFVGGYEHDSRAGVLHVANHHVSPGKKQWTWGHSDFGQAWDRNLTDEDGPYIELMAGVFTDNQPDFSWLMPYEEKTFTQYFLPYRELGMVKNANRDFLLGLEEHSDMAVVRVMATSSQVVRIRISDGEKTISEQLLNLRPERIFEQQIPVNAVAGFSRLHIQLLDESGRELLAHDPGRIKASEIPAPARPALSPVEIDTTEQLYLTGLHLEQYRHATYDPVDYYAEALRRDPSDVRNNNALGGWYLRRGQWKMAEPFFRKAIQTLTQRNANPYDGESFYQLGICLRWLQKEEEAYSSFYKGTWNSGSKEACFFQLAQMDTAKGNYQEAFLHINQCLDRNAGNSKAYALKMALLRKRGQWEEAQRVGEQALERDRFNLAIYFENYLLSCNDGGDTASVLADLFRLGGNGEHNYLEFAGDYIAAGLLSEALQLLQCYSERHAQTGSPLFWYYLAWLCEKLGDTVGAGEAFRKAAHAGQISFPNRPLDIIILEHAIASASTDHLAPYLLGNLWYDKRQYEEAISCWELSASRNNQFATVHRNLGIAYYNKHSNVEAARTSYEKAFALNPQDARVLMELDQLYKRLNEHPATRLRFLEEHLPVVLQRDDLYLERAALYNFLNKSDKALQLIMDRKFHPWEGGEGKVAGQYCYSLVELAKICLQRNEPGAAIAYLQRAQTYPHNLGEGKLYGALENDIFYWLGVAWEADGYPDQARTSFLLATEGNAGLNAAISYNDQQPDKVFYQGLAWARLGDLEKSQRIFDALVDYGTAQMNAEVEVDYFAVSLPDLLIFDDDLSKRNRIHCHYMAGLGRLGRQEYKEAIALFKKGLMEDAMHIGCKTHLALAELMMKTQEILQEE